MATDSDLSNQLFLVIAQFTRAAYEIAYHDRAAFEREIVKALTQLDAFMDNKAASQ